MLYPMFLMVCLTFVVGCIAVKVRFASVKHGDVSIKYYRTMDGQNVPDVVTKTTRHFNNQFEIPVLFYVVCTLFLSLKVSAPLAELFAWLFVGFRVIHSMVHLTYNHVLHRMLAFWASFLCVMALWVILLLSI